MRAATPSLRCATSSRAAPRARSRSWPTSTAIRSAEENIQAVLDFGEKVAAVGQVTSVESPFVINNPVTGEPLPAATVAQLYADPNSLPPDQQAYLEQLRERYMAGSTVRLVAHYDGRRNQARRPRPHDPDAQPCRRATRSARPGRRLHRRQLRHARVDAGTDAVGGRGDAADQRGGVVPAVRVGRHPDQGSDHDAALDHRQLRRPGLDLPGGQLRRAAQLHAARLHHRRQPGDHVRGHLRAVHGLRGAVALAHPGGLPADRRQHGVRCRRACPRPPRSSPARR